MNIVYNFLEKLRSLTLPVKGVLWMGFFTLLIIPFRIFSYNYWPIDDVNRHVAKVISGKSWPEILVMDPQFQTLDHNGGWHFILGLIHQLGADADTMVLFSCIGLFLLLTLSGLFIFNQQPLAWLCAMFLAGYTTDITRWMFGRPFIISASTVLIIIHLWNREVMTLKSRWGWSLLLFTLASWVHGAWYLLILLPFSFALAGKIKTALQIASAWAIGSICAGLLTGDPVHFLIQQFFQTLSSVDSASVTRVLVGEFQPRMNVMPIIFGLIIFILLKLFKIPSVNITKNPGFWLAVTGWILGMTNGRFWLDWGTVGFLYLIASALTLVFEHKEFNLLSRNLCHVLLGCAAVFFIYTTDFNSRWSNNNFRDRLSLEDPAHTEWLPEPGGILYSDSMTMYYETFYNNPHGEWRYILGHEPALMPAEDLKVYREIQFYKHTIDSLFDPWVNKIRPEDRLILYRGKSSRPDIPQLEWKYVAYNTWSGRVPKLLPDDQRTISETPNL